jgi:ribosomal protein L40E
MKLCPYCGHANSDQATQCRKCDGPFVVRPVTTTKPQKSLWIGPGRAREIRQKALSAVALGLLLKVYWGGYGFWPVIDYGPWAQIRPWIEPVLLYGGGLGYVLGWVLRVV